MPELSASLQSQLDSLYNYKPPKLGSSHGPYPKLDATVSFHDKHMDPRLALRRVILAPNLVHDLVAAGERALQTYKDSTDVELPSVSKGFVLPQTSRDDVVDARSVGLVYAKGIAAPAIAIASMLLLHPNAPEWSDSLHFFENNRTTEKSDALNEDFAPSFMRRFDLMDANLFNKTMAESMDESTRTRYRKAHEKFRRAAVWQMFFIRREARRALKRMDTVASSVTSKYPTFRTKAPKIGPGSLDLPCFLDALETAWGLSMPKFLEAMLQVRAGSLPFRRSQRLAANIGEKAKSPEPPPLLRGRKTSKSSPSSGSPQIRSDWSTVLIPSYSESSKTDEEVAMSIIHRAWARAVEKDATFIVLHCGTYERIALRHRSSQTLFLSNLIKTTECSDPGYGAIHIGLFVSILSDVFDRVMQIEEQSTQISKKRRRPAVRAIEPHKRPRTRTIVASEEARKVTEQRQFQIMVDEISSRHLALLRMQYDKFNSPVPASFLRHNSSFTHTPGKSSYKPKEYFILTLTSYIGDGSTGDVHGATLELLGNDEVVHSYSNAVVKFAFLPAQRQRLRHEFKVYQQLKLSGVTCIPQIFGLFKDVEGDTLALIMTNAGKSLADRRPDLQSSVFYVSKEERDKFAEALQSIHDQGFRHRDIRPENLLVSEDGSVKIIDFDCTSLDSSERTREREMKHLMDVLNGLDYGATGVEFVSLGSFRQSETSSTTTSKGWEKSVDNSDRTDTGSEMSNSSNEVLTSTSLDTDLDLTEFF